MNAEKLQASKQAYTKILKLIKKNKDLCLFDVSALEHTAKCHLLGLELNEVHGLNINPINVSSLDWIDCGEYVNIGLYGEKYRRTISWPDLGEQPQDEYLVKIGFSTGAFIFAIDGGTFNAEYPTKFFHKFWLELLTYKPDYSDSHNHSLYWKVENAKEIFNSFTSILQKYNDLNEQDVKQRRIEKMKADLAALEKSI